MASEAVSHLPWDEAILPLHERLPPGKRQGRKKREALLKGPPEVATISSAGVVDLYCFEKTKTNPLKASTKLGMFIMKTTKKYPILVHPTGYCCLSYILNNPKTWILSGF